MAVFAIPNPKKSMQIDFPIDRVLQSVKTINVFQKKYKLQSSNEILNQFTYESFEFLSLGVYIDVQLNSLSENKTEIHVEVRRKVGSFDQSYEITKANEHLANVFEGISKGLSMSPEELQKISEQVIVPKASTSGCAGVLLALISMGLMFAITLLFVL